MNTMPFRIHQYLNFHVSSVLQVTFQVDTIVVEGFSYLVLCHRKDSLKLVGLLDQANTTATTACNSFQHQGKANPLGGLCRFSKGTQNGCSWQGWQPRACHCFTCRYLVTHDRHDICGRPNKGDIDVCANLSKAGVLRKKAIA